MDTRRDAARQLLSRTALRISQLPATDGGKLAAVTNLNSRLRDLKDRLELGGGDKVAELREKLQGLYSSPSSEGGPPAESAVAPPASSADSHEEPAGKPAAR